MRERKRHELAKRICSLSYSELLKWGITRVADLTGLDTIGLPVYTACRPPGEVITISAGKGLNHIDSKAGAVLEGVELWAAEHPELDPYWHFSSYNELKAPAIPFDMLQMARDAPVNGNTPMAWDEMSDIFRDGQILVPSDMVWLMPRVKPPFQYFQSSSSGLAAGIDFQDALLQGTYEVIERDGWAISEFVQEQTGQWREVVSLDGVLPDSLQLCMDRLKSASVVPFLFDLTRDVRVPIFRCTILDESHNSPGAFSGFGCSLDPVTAARRAITEACQARAAYIGGARDDLFRRRFILMKNIRMDILLEMYRSLPQVREFCQYKPRGFESISEEWEEVSSALKSSEINEVYCKTLYVSSNPDFVIVKVICPQLETPLWEHYATGKRAQAALK